MKNVLILKNFDFSSNAIKNEKIITEAWNAYAFVYAQNKYIYKCETGPILYAIHLKENDDVLIDILNDDNNDGTFIPPDDGSRNYYEYLAVATVKGIIDKPVVNTDGTYIGEVTSIKSLTGTFLQKQKIAYKATEECTLLITISRGQKVNVARV